MIFDAIYPNYHLNMNELMGFEVEENNDLKDWEVNVKFQDTIIANPDGTTTRLTNYMNLNNVENLKHVPSWINGFRTIL